MEQARHPELPQARPIWILAGGWILALLAAAVNVDFMIRAGVSVSHLTGDFSRITLETVKGGGTWTSEAAILGVSIGGFVGGAACSGFFIHHPVIEIARPYGRSLLAIGVVFLLADRLVPRNLAASCFLSAWACGMQNALATRYRGMVLRTTHITGLLTDVGQFIGMRLRGHQVDGWKITTPLAIFTAFAAGSGIGAWMVLALDQPVVRWCGWIYIGGGLGWTMFKHLVLADRRGPEGG